MGFSRSTAMVWIGGQEYMPCFTALRETIFFPVGVRGPVDFCPFRRRASRCAGVRVRPFCADIGFTSTFGIGGPWRAHPKAAAHGYQAVLAVIGFVSKGVQIQRTCWLRFGFVWVRS